MKKQQISCTRRATAAFKQLEKWRAERAFLDLDLHEECRDTWNVHYAIFQIQLDSAGAEFFDWDGCIDSLQETVLKALGPEFHAFRNGIQWADARNRYDALPDGSLVVIFHGEVHGEVEIYRKGFTS